MKHQTKDYSEVGFEPIATQIPLNAISKFDCQDNFIEVFDKDKIVNIWSHRNSNILAVEVLD
ncbi:hypothetical protein [Helicobacter sp. 11S03491-1]|uniref:hypothetical protein n=1 Tax=Helicobacter sp. 11S03491-1 TaxID=1476196 RepID=UPI000BA71D6B|nr:hypothetical protein [Helicobacter sp. 11S03491-1]PAF41295.1 hypothetical protein BKH45_07215 [Helicobacter sp. 11S03491-1]